MHHSVSCKPVFATALAAGLTTIALVWCASLVWLGTSLVLEKTSTQIFIVMDAHTASITVHRNSRDSTEQQARLAP